MVIVGGLVSILTVGISYCCYLVKHAGVTNLLTIILSLGCVMATLGLTIMMPGLPEKIGVIGVVILAATMNYLMFWHEKRTAREDDTQFDWIDSGNQHMGFQHIIQNHGEAFAAQGVSQTAIPKLVAKAVNSYHRSGGHFDKWQPYHRVLLTIHYRYRKHLLAVTLSRDQYIISAYPAPLLDKYPRVKKIRIMLEYGCYPIWLYDEKGNLISNDLPQVLRKDATLNKKLLVLQKQYDSLFTNNQHDFSYNGFATAADEQQFLRAFMVIHKDLKRRLGGKYAVLNKITGKVDKVFPTATTVASSQAIPSEAELNSAIVNKPKPVVDKKAKTHVRTYPGLKADLLKVYQNFDIENLGPTYDALVDITKLYRRRFTKYTGQVTLKTVQQSTAKDYILGHTDKNLSEIVANNKDMVAKNIGNAAMCRQVMQLIDIMSRYTLDELCFKCHLARLQLSTTNAHKRLLKTCPDCGAVFVNNKLTNITITGLPDNKLQVKMYLRKTGVVSMAAATESIDTTMPKRKIRLFMEWVSSFIWVYNEDNELIKNGLPDELYPDSGLVAKVNVLNRQYSELFTNNGYEFRYNGFKTHEDENAFERDFNAIYEEIAERTRGKYRVINEYYFTSNTEDVRDL
ncbi:hypothetical protein [Lactiplantibacillus plantarum]|uniref:hypothetical protein n=1 Tax=Lactiplantibacillus plantarum TaxID=1590 RepID=UPI002ACC0A5D|nr:hypothetical protein [Lactiplantibacillus plantarum]